MNSIAGTGKNRGKTAARDESLGQLQISAGGMVAIGDEFAGGAAQRVLDMARPQVALYVGGMGARDKNFYNTIMQKYGYVDEAIEIQDLYLDGKKEEAAASIPLAMVEDVALVGPADKIKDELDKWRETCITEVLLSGPAMMLPIYAELING